LIGIKWKRNAKVRLFKETAKFFPQKSAGCEKSHLLMGYVTYYRLATNV
jgi:hypothetical protein